MVYYDINRLFISFISPNQIPQTQAQPRYEYGHEYYHHINHKFMYNWQPTNYMISHLYLIFDYVLFDNKTKHENNNNILFIWKRKSKIGQRPQAIMNQSDAYYVYTYLYLLCIILLLYFSLLWLCLFWCCYCVLFVFHLF